MPTVVEFGKYAFTDSQYLGDQGQRFGDALETSWPIGVRVLDYQVPEGFTFDAESLLVSCHHDCGTDPKGVDTVAYSVATRLGVMAVMYNAVAVSEWPYYTPMPVWNPTSLAGAHSTRWSPECRRPISFDDGIIVPSGVAFGLRWTASQATNPPGRVSYSVWTDAGIYHGETTLNNNTTTAQTIWTITPGADLTVYGFTYEVRCSYPLLSMLQVRVNGSTWFQGMNMGSPSATGGTVSSVMYSIPLFSATFNPGDRIVVGAHAPLDLGQIVTAQLTGTTTPLGGTVFVRRPGTHLRF